MASRTKQKEAARARRVAEERARAERAERERRMRMLGGVVLAAIAVIVAVIVISSSSSGGGKVPTPNSAAAKAVQTRVDSLLAGIPQSGTTLGNPSAKITVTEYGDLECAYCDAFALATNATSPGGVPGTGMLDQLISQYVRAGKIKIVYRALETSSSLSPVPNAFVNGQTGVYAAGLQNKAWYYMELFYNEQGKEGTGYATISYLDGIAKQTPGLNFSAWQSGLNNQSLQAKVVSDNRNGIAIDGGSAGTPTIVVTGPRGQAQAINGLPSSFGQLQSRINSVA